MQETMAANFEMVREYPWYVGLLSLYLLVVFCMSCFRAVVLARRLWFLPKSKGVDGSIGVAGLAMAGKIPPQSDVALISSVCGRDQANFEYVWERCSGMVLRIKRQSWLTVLLTLFATAWLTRDVLDQVWRQKAVGIPAIADGIAGAAEVCCHGLFFSAVLYLLYMLFEGMLMRRKREWEYFYSRADLDRKRSSTPE